MKFEKYHGAGNDFVIFDDLSNSFSKEQMSELAKKLCHRHFGIGADGLIAVKKVDGLYFMDYWNIDGSFAEMCGNGVRCTAHYIVKNIEKSNPSSLVLKTGDGDKPLEISYTNGELSSVTVNLGKPRFLESVSFDIDGIPFHGDKVSMGNPHFVLFDKALSDDMVLTFGKKLENKTEYFENKTNVEFAEITSRDAINLRVWERGCGETLACGTGASATVVSGILQNLLNSKVVVSLPGGELTIQWNGEGEDLFLSGPSKFVFETNISI